jgi:TetR/AcrR family transcriptional repressor of uid operon
MSRLASPELAERRRRQILDAALDCFRRRGFHQSSMQEICAAAGISAGALYRYFGSKAEIITAIAEDERRDSSVVFSAANGTVIDGLCKVAERFFRKLAAGDGALVADVLAEASRDPILARNLALFDKQYVIACAEMIGAGQVRGEVDPALDPVEAAQTLFAAIEGVGLRAATFGQTQFDGAAAQFRDLAERYLAVRV